MNLKDKSSNKKRIIIFEWPFYSRILLLISAIVFPAILIFNVFTGQCNKLESILIFIGSALYIILVFFEVFKNYICIDINKKELIIREWGGFKKEIISIDRVHEIKIDTNRIGRENFPIIIVLYGYIKRIKSWNIYNGRYSCLERFSKRIKRIEKFCKECNEYLAIYREEKANK